VMQPKARALAATVAVDDRLRGSRRDNLAVSA